MRQASRWVLSVVDGSRYLDAEPLRVIDTDILESIQSGIVFDKFSDSALAHDMPNLIDRLYQFEIYPILAHITHEKAVDFQKVDRQGFQVTKRRKSTAEII
jgi:hypothetical protein